MCSIFVIPAFTELFLKCCQALRIKRPVFCILYLAHLSTQTIKDYVELISTTTGDAPVQSYGPRLQITPCPSHKEQPRNT